LDPPSHVPFVFCFERIEAEATELFDLYRAKSEVAGGA
jgi:hypothetical protein